MSEGPAPAESLSTALYPFGPAGEVAVVRDRFGFAVLNATAQPAYLAPTYRRCTQRQGYRIAPHGSFFVDMVPALIYVRIGRVCRRIPLPALEVSA